MSNDILNNNNIFNILHMVTWLSFYKVNELLHRIKVVVYS